MVSAAAAAAAATAAATATAAANTNTDSDTDTDTDSYPNTDSDSDSWHSRPGRTCIRQNRTNLEHCRNADNQCVEWRLRLLGRKQLQFAEHLHNQYTPEERQHHGFPGGSTRNDRRLHDGQQPFVRQSVNFAKLGKQQHFQGILCSCRLQQQKIGDCFWLGAVEAIVNKDPKLIANMITQTSGNTFTVKFPNGTSKAITLTAGEIAETGSPVYNNGSWLTVMTLAECQTIGGNTSTPISPVALGGYPTQTFTLLTGQTYQNMSIYSAAPSAAQVSKLNTLLSTASANKIPIGVQSINHELSVVSYNPNGNMVTILNPWGISGSYTPEAGSSYGSGTVYQTAGLFTISTTQLAQDFIYLTVPSTLLSSISAMSAPAALARSAASIIPSAVGLSQNALAAGAFSPSVLGASNLQVHLNAVPVATDLRIPGTIANLNNAPKGKLSAQDFAEKLQAIGFTEPDTMSRESFYKVGQGSVLVMQDKDSQIALNNAKVQVEGGSAAFIVQIGDNAAVCNLSDKRSGSVAIMIGKDRVDVPMGRAIILSQADQKGTIPFADALGLQDSGSAGKYGDVTAYAGKFSVLHVMKNCPQLKQLAKSSTPDERKLAMKLMKSGAAVATLQGRL